MEKTKTKPLGSAEYVKVIRTFKKSTRRVLSAAVKLLHTHIRTDVRTELLITISPATPTGGRRD